MTDRYSGYTVTLDKEIREDDAELILNAIRMIKGVISVEPTIADMNHYHAKQMMVWKLRQEIMDLFKNFKWEDG